MAKKRSIKQNEVCRQLDIQPYVLRYWETEFPFLKSSKASGAQRSFSPEEVELLGRIRTLLYDEGYTIAGARKRIEAERAGTAEPASAAAPAAAPASKRGKAGAKSAAAAAQTKKLRTGIVDALAQARAILASLESS